MDESMTQSSSANSDRKQQLPPTPPSLPLSGVKVLDLSRVLAGPYCTMLLGDLGAEVVKVENPHGGDDTRAWGPPYAGSESAYYLSCNRNKRGMTLNLKSEQGQKIAKQLAIQSDVLVENFLPGTLDRWGLGYEELAELNPRLIYCSITGFGQTGPRRNEPGYDIVIQGMAGVMSVTGERDGRPMKVGIAISDITTGMFACNAINAALYARDRTGRGDRIDMALFDSTIAWLANIGSTYLVSGEIPRRLGVSHPSVVPYQSFEAADQPLIIAVGNDGQFRHLCEVLGVPATADDERFVTNEQRVKHRDALEILLAGRFSKRPVHEWLAELHDRTVPCGPVNTMDQVFSDPQIAPRHLVQEVEHPTIGTLKLAGSPFKMRSIEKPPLCAPPLLGQHTDELLQERLGLTEADVARLRADGVI